MREFPAIREILFQGICRGENNPRNTTPPAEMREFSLKRENKRPVNNPPFANLCLGNNNSKQTTLSCFRSPYAENRARQHVQQSIDTFYDSNTTTIPTWAKDWNKRTHHTPRDR